MQRPDASQLLLGGLAAALEVLVAAVQHLLGAGLRLGEDLVGGGACVVGDAAGVVTGGGQHGGGLLLPLLDGHVALGGLLVELGRPRDELLLDLVAVPLGVGTGLLHEPGGLVGGAAADVGRLVLGESQDLLRAEAEALLGDRAVGLLRAGRAQLALDRAGVLLGGLAGRLGGGDPVAELAQLRVDLVAVVAATDDVEGGSGGGRDAPTAVDGVRGGADRHGR
ncbi:hypothetical protein BJF90_10980 [Pseudonocardia sp. CNS-004]|nr:hypothetical protein BJF90_10980 [Pseudonocardia sp. CNS-004]